MDCRLLLTLLLVLVRARLGSSVNMSTTTPPDNMTSSAMALVPTNTTALNTSSGTPAAPENNTSNHPSTTNVSSSTSSPPESRTAFGLTFSSNETFISSLSNHSSEEFLNRVNRTKAQIEPIYRDVSGFVELNVRSFMNGSIVTDIELIFRPGQDGVLTAENVTNTFIRAVESGAVSFPVIRDSINVTAIGAPPTTQSPSSTTSHMTSTQSTRTTTGTAGAPENNTSSHQSTSNVSSTSSPPESLVAFGLTFSSNETFISSLSNHSSEEFMNRVNRTKAQLKPIYQNVSGFDELNVRNFTNGSIVTDVELIFSPGQDGVLTAENVTNTFIRAVESGDVSFPVIPNSINVTTIRTPTTQSPSSTMATSGMTSTQSTRTTTVAAASAPVMKSLLLLLICSTGLLILILI